MAIASGAWAFCAVSSDGQSDTLPFQRAWAAERCTERGWKLERVIEAVSSGQKGARAALTRMVDELDALPKAQRPGRILMIRLDRLGRGDDGGLDTLLALKRLVRDLGITVHTRQDGDVAFARVADMLMPMMRIFTGAFENEARSDKRRATIARKRAAGLPVSPNCPYGLMFDASMRHVAREPQADAVRLAFRLRGEGMGYYSIGKRLYEVAPPNVYVAGERHIRWSTTAVIRMLVRREYIGTVVDEMTFARAQRTGEDRLAQFPPRPARHPWPLTSAIRCWCGYSMSGVTSGKNVKKRQRYYCCRNNRAHNGFRLRRVGAVGVEKQFVALLHRLSADPSLVAAARVRIVQPDRALIDRAISETRGRLEAMERQRERIWQMHERGQLRDEDLQERLDAASADRVELRARIRELEHERSIAVVAERDEADVAAVIARAAATYERANVDEQRAVALSVARALGGLTVAADGSLTIGAPPKQRSLVSSL